MCGFKVIFRTISTELHALDSSHEAFSSELGVFIVKLKTFGANFTRSPSFWTDGTEAHKTVLMCVDAIKSKYQLLNKCKLLFHLVVHQQQHLHCLWQYFNLFGEVWEKFHQT